MFPYPDWSDLARVPEQTRYTWDGEVARRMRYRYYYDGLIFKEKLPIEAGIEEENIPLRYPVAINLVKMLCQATTDSEFGEWDEQIVRFDPRNDIEVGSSEEGASKLLMNILTNSNAASMLWEVGLDRNIYGGGVIGIKPDLKMPGHIRWNRVPLDAFFPVFNPDNPDELIECWVVVPMDQEQAKIKYGIDASKPVVYRVEHWTLKDYTNEIDGKNIEAYSGINPWGVIPFAFIPRLRSSTWWGESLTEDVMPIQDDLNGRMADLSEAINYNAHPTRYGYNLPRTFNAKNYPLGSNVMWDLGRVIGNSPEPKVDILEAKNPIPQGTFDYIKWIYDWGRTSSFAPPIAFGEDNGGGQRSGITLEIRMWPLIKSMRRSRAYFSAGLMRAAKISATILQQKRFDDVPTRSLQAILDGSIVPTFAPIMPRDQSAIVDEVTKRLSTNPPTLSLPTAVKMLGQGPSEVKRIEKMMEDQFTKRMDEMLKTAEIQAKTKPVSDVGNDKGDK